MALQSVSQVAANILSRQDSLCLDVSSLYTLCSRVYSEHLLPELGLSSSSMPLQLHSLGTFTDYLHHQCTSSIVLVGQNGSFRAQLVREGELAVGHAAPSHAHSTGTGGDRPRPEARQSPDISGENSTMLYGEDSWTVGYATPKVEEHGLPLPREQVARIRQMLCRCLFDHIISEAGALNLGSAVSLEEARQLCVRYLVEALKEVPEFYDETQTEDFVLGTDLYHMAVGSNQSKLVFKRPPVASPMTKTSPPYPPPMTPCFSPLEPRPPSPSPPYCSPLAWPHSASPMPHSFSPAQSPFPGSAVHTVHVPSAHGALRFPSSASYNSVIEPDYILRASDNNPLRTGQLNTDLFGPGPRALRKPVDRTRPLGPADPTCLVPWPSAQASPILKDAVVAFLRSRNAFDGPKSQAVEAMRTQLLASPELAHEPALASLSAFHSFLLSMPTVQVWTSKTSDIMRCILQRGTVDGPLGRPEMHFSTALSQSESDLHALMSQLPTLYKAVHVFLISRTPPAIDVHSSVPVHILLRALRSNLCAGAQWATHPGLRSAPILLKFLKADSALGSGGHDTDKADLAPLYLKQNHTSYRTALKALEVFMGVLSRDNSSGHSSPAIALTSQLCTPNSVATPSDTTTTETPAAITGDLSSDTPPSAGSGPATVQSGYPSIGLSVELWGPTASEQMLAQFLDANMHARSWGLDCKTCSGGANSNSQASAGPSGSPERRLSGNSTSSTLRPVSGMTLLTLSTCNECLVWDMSAGGVPHRLREWLEDSSIRKCRVSADGLVTMLRKCSGIEAAGVVDLRRLHAATGPEDPEVANGKLPAIVAAVLGVRITPSAALNQSHWAARPLSPAQTHYTMQSAWVHAHLLERLGEALGWDQAKLQACIMT